MTGARYPAGMTPARPRIARGMAEADWHATRARNIGSSEIAALFDLPDEQLPAYMVRRFALWHVKAGDAPAPDVGGDRPKWGLRLEAAIAGAAAEHEDWQIEQGGYVADSTTPGLGCTLDFVIDGDPDEDGPGALECKNVDWLIHWFKAEAAEICHETLKSGGGKPLVQRIADLRTAFQEMGVTAAQLERKRGRRIDDFLPEDVGALRVVYGSLKRGEVTVAEEFPSGEAAPTGDKLDAIEQASTETPQEAAGAPEAPAPPVARRQPNSPTARHEAAALPIIPVLVQSQPPMMPLA